MWIVEVHPSEERLRRRLAQPLERMVDDFTAGTLRRVDAGGELVLR